MNPVLIKPSGERHSQVIVMGKPYADTDARSYQALKEQLRPIVADALADLRSRYDVVICEGAGSPGRDQPARGRHHEHGPRARRRPAGARRRRHRPRRRVRLAVRHARAARAGRPGADRRLRHQQVPRRRVDPRAGLEGPARAHRPARARRAAVRRGSVDGRRGLAGPGGARARGARRRRRRHARRRRAAAALDEQLHRRRRARLRARRARALHPLAGRRRARRPRRHPRDEGDRRGPRAAARRRPGPGAAGAGGGGRADPRDLRRLPDARPADRRPDRIRRPHGRRARPAAGADGVRARQDPAPPGRRVRVARRRAHDDRLRDPPRPRPAPGRRAAAARRRRRARRLPPRLDARHRLARRAGGRLRCGARCSSPSARRAGAPSSPGRARSRRPRERRLDALGDLVESHLDTDAVLALLEHGAPPTCPRSSRCRSSV